MLRRGLRFGMRLNVSSLALTVAPLVTKQDAVQDAIAATGMKLCEHQDLTSHLTPYFKCMLTAVKESKLPLQMKGVSMARLQAYEEDLVTRFDAVKQRAFAWGMFSAKNLFSSDALLNGAINAAGQCPDQIEEVRHLASCCNMLTTLRGSAS